MFVEWVILRYQNLEIIIIIIMRIIIRIRIRIIIIIIIITSCLCEMEKEKKMGRWGAPVLLKPSNQRRCSRADLDGRASVGCRTEATPRP